MVSLLGSDRNGAPPTHILNIGDQGPPAILLYLHPALLFRSRVYVERLDYNFFPSAPEASGLVVDFPGLQRRKLPPNTADLVVLIR